MKEIKLTKKDLSEISSKAKKNFSTNTVRYEFEYFLCECFIKSFLDFCAKHDLLISKGKMYKDKSKLKKDDKIEELQELLRIKKVELKNEKLNSTRLFKENNKLKQELEKHKPEVKVGLPKTYKR